MQDNSLTLDIVQDHLKRLNTKINASNELDDMDIKFLLFIAFQILLGENTDELCRCLLTSILSLIDISTQITASNFSAKSCGVDSKEELPYNDTLINFTNPIFEQMAKEDKND